MGGRWARNVIWLRQHRDRQRAAREEVMGWKENSALLLFLLLPCSSPLAKVKKRDQTISIEADLSIEATSEPFSVKPKSPSSRVPEKNKLPKNVKTKKKLSKKAK